MPDKYDKNPILQFLCLLLLPFIAAIILGRFENIGNKLPWWGYLLALAVGALISGMVYRDTIPHLIKEVISFLSLQFRHRVVIEDEEFPSILKHYLVRRPRDGQGILSFYNIPLATLKDDAARTELWVKAIALNTRVKELRLLLQRGTVNDLYEGLQKIRDEDPKLDKSQNYSPILTALVEKMIVAVVEFPQEEVLNFACVLEDDLSKRPVFSSTTIMAPPFWNGTKFSHFFAFKGQNKHSNGVCNIIRDHIKNIWDKVQTPLPASVTLTVPATPQNEAPRKITVTITQLIKTADILKKVKETV